MLTVLVRAMGVVGLLFLTACADEVDGDPALCFDLTVEECTDYPRCEVGRLLPWNDADSCWDTGRLGACVPKDLGPAKGCNGLIGCLKDSDGNIWRASDCVQELGWEHLPPGGCKVGPACE